MGTKTNRLTGKQRRQAARFRICLYGFFILLSAVIGVTETAEKESVNALAKAADVLGLLAFGILTLQFFLASRLPWIERPFGLDRVIRFHRSMGVVAATLLIAHPVLMTLSGEPELLAKLLVPWQIQVARVAVLMLFATVFISLRRTALRIPYERWRTWHNVAALSVLASAFTHSFFVEGGIHTTLGRIFWIALVALAFSAWGYRQFGEWHQHQAGRYIVAGVIPEANQTSSLILQPEGGRNIPPRLPGQFAFIRLLRGHGAGEEHPFTIASSPQQDELVFTIRKAGDFSGDIHQIAPGTPVRVNGPYGRFSAELYPEDRELVFIAGGVGITPFLSMLRNMRDSDNWRPVTLLHACRTEDDLLMRDELAEMQRKAPESLRIVHLLSKPSDAWQGACGHIDRDFIQKHVPEAVKEGTGFYICGPPGFMRAVESALRALDVPRHRRRTEKFSL